MKKYFLTGLALLLPALLTLAIVAFLVNLLTDPFINALEGTLNYYQMGGNQPYSLAKNTALQLVIRFFTLGLIFLFIILIGFLTRTFFVYSLLSMADNLIHRIPIINRVYKTIQEVTHTLFSSKNSSFKQVVLVPYPNESSLSIGFATAVASESNEPKLKDKIPIFVPGTPNPTFGFILLFSKDQVIYIDMKVEEAFKLLVSCGIMLPPVQGMSDENKT